jgi:hypothetical protein
MPLIGGAALSRARTGAGTVGARVARPPVRDSRPVRIDSGAQPPRVDAETTWVGAKMTTRSFIKSYCRDGHWRRRMRSGGNVQAAPPLSAPK